MGDRVHRTRWFATPIALVAVGAGLIGCSSGATTSESIPAVSTNTAVTGAVAPSTTVVVPRPATTVVTDVAPSAVPSADGAALLQGALAAMATGYHFTTTLSVDGAAVLTADGDRVGEGTRLGVVKDGVTVQYVITPAGTWVQPEGGDWQQLETGASSSDPIAALATPTSVTVTGVEGTATLLDAVVPAAQLGLTGDAPLTVSARIDNGAITSVGYTTAIDGHPATMQAVIGPVVDPSPVVPPV